MSTRQMAQRFSHSGSRGGSGLGMLADADIFGLGAKRRAKEAQTMSDIDLAHEKALEEIRHSHEKELEELKAKQLKELDNNKSLNSFFERNNIAKDSPQANTIKEQIMTNTSLEQGLRTKSLQQPESQSAMDFGTRSALSGVKPADMTSSTGPNTISTMPNVPGLTGPSGTGIGLQTIKGPLESRTATEVGGMTLPPSKAFPQGFTLPGKPSIQTTFGDSEISYPRNPAYKNTSATREENDVGVMENTTSPNSVHIDTMPVQQTLLPPIGEDYQKSEFNVAPPTSNTPVGGLSTMPQGNISGMPPGIDPTILLKLLGKMNPMFMGQRGTNSNY